MTGAETVLSTFPYHATTFLIFSATKRNKSGGPSAASLKEGESVARVSWLLFSSSVEMPVGKEKAQFRSKASVEPILEVGQD